MIGPLFCRSKLFRRIAKCYDNLAELFDHLAKDGKQVVISRDSLAKDLEGQTLRRAGLLVFLFAKG